MMSAHLLFAIAWKTYLVSAGVLILLLAARAHPPADKARLLLGGLVLLPLVPLVSALLPPLQVPMAEASPLAAGPQVFELAASSSIAPATSVVMVTESSGPSWDSLFTTLWLSGAFILLIRLGWGLLTLRSWTVKAQKARSRSWMAALQRCRAENIPILVSERVDAPLSWGWYRPVILISPEILKEASGAEAIVAHEVAHIRRRDWVSLILARVIVALFWLNPLVWLMERALRHEIEEAADAEAVQIVEPAKYADVLLKIASRRPLIMAANSIAAGGVGRRIMLVLQGSQVRTSRWKVVVTLGALGLAAPVAALQFVPYSPVALKPTLPMVAAAIAAPAPTSAIQPQKAQSITNEQLDNGEIGETLKHARIELSRIKTPEFQAQIERARIAARSVDSATLVTAVAHARSSSEALDSADNLVVAVAEASQISERVRGSVGDSMKRMSESMERGAAGMERGAAGMERGALGMERGARKMRQEAQRLRDPAYRQRKIAEEAARGHRVTERELIDSIPELEKGADEMVEGAAEMRRGAVEMRRGAIEMSREARSR